MADIPTLQTYLESVLKNVRKEKGATDSLITHEKKSLEQAFLKQRLREIGYIKHLEKIHYLDIDQITDSLKKVRH